MQQPITCALLSVYDKSGIVELARSLDESGVELISTGGTARALRDAGLPVTDVSQITGFPEIMDGRVKTLHPLIHGGLLGRLDNADDRREMEQHGIRSIDLVISNLYPFAQTSANPNSTHEEIIEQIDIGGPAMIRASAKNYLHTAIVTSPDAYHAITEELRSNSMTLSEATRRRLAGEAFAHTAAYDGLVAAYFSRSEPDSASNDHSSMLDTPFGDILTITMPRVQSLRYGENPHQQAALYGGFSKIFEQLHGKELSYNNILDIDAASRLVLEFEAPTVVIVKHTNPCGVASGATLAEAWAKAFATDTKSPFGGIIAVNRPLDIETATAINGIFTEVVIAPDFALDVLDFLRRKKDRRLIGANYGALLRSLAREVRSVAGGVLAQSTDIALLDESARRTVTERQPSDEERSAMEFAWRIAKHVKSNAIVYAAHDRTLGIGAGQMSRVDSALTARRKADEAGLDLKGCAVASDAFFPFADGLLEAVQAGATAVIQPGGSIRDHEVIDAANANGIAMIFTGMRHFRH